MNYIYTTQPLPDVNTYGDFAAFVVVSAVVLILAALMYSLASHKVARRIIAIATAIVVSVVAYWSLATGDIVTRENTPVTARLVSVTTGQVTSGKHATTAGFVSYEIQGAGVITLRVNSSSAYPNEATFYRNPRTRHDAWR